MRTRLTAAQAQQQAGRNWRVVAGRLHATFDTGNLARGIELVRRVGEAADELDHHPDLDVRYARVHVVTVSHDVGGLTGRDIRLAAAVSRIAAELDLEAAAARPQDVEIGVHALDVAAVRPFWRAVLGYEQSAPDADAPDLVDPDGRGPAVRFRQLDAPGPHRNRICIDVFVPHDAVERRVRAALDAGARLVSHAHRPSCWVLADPEGNEASLNTWQADPSEKTSTN